MHNLAARGRLARSLVAVMAISALLALLATNAGASVVVGKVWAWGLDNQGSLGDGMLSGETGTPVEVQGINEIYAVAGGTDGEGGYALRNDGTVWAWGYGGVGQLGDGSPSGSDVPVQVSGLSGVVAVAGGSADGYALLSDGTVEAWGENQEGQLGIGHAGPYSDVPVEVASLSGVTSIASGYGTVYALKSDGAVWAWGSNREGVLGAGSASAYSATPVQVSGLHEVVALGGSPSFDGYAVKKDGTVWAWGDNSLGALGNGKASSPGYSDVPIEVSGITNAAAVQGTGGAAYALLSNGHVDSWGDNSSGQLGIGDDGACCNSYIPVEVHSLTEVTAIAAGNDNGYALARDGTVWAWGDSGYGLLGNGATGGPLGDTPAPVSGLKDAIGIAATSHGSFGIADFVSSTPPTLPVTTTPTPPPPAPASIYVALGDSYSSGEGVSPFLAGSDTAHDRCHRSTRAYAELLRGKPGFPSTLEFGACSGAKVANMYPGKGQYGERGQLELLSSQDAIVSLTIGGNDVGFGLIIKSCVLLPACYLSDNLPTRVLIKHTLKRLPSLYRAMLTRAPDAQVYVLGYPHFFSPHPSLFCNGIDRLEANWISQMEDLFNEGAQKAIRKLADHRLHYVDTDNAFAGGELCSKKKPVYMNGVIKAHHEYSFHPTAAGQARLAHVLAIAVRRG
ncbi:MAG: GDSL-type esterase/lipase family protein [Solirubrobacteraceae bacterium]